MAGPPAVAWDVRPSRVHRVVVVLAMLFAALAALAYLTLQPWGISSFFIVFTVGVSALFAWSGLRRESVGTLVWDGSHWLWRRGDHDTVCTVRCMIDFQRWMLLRVRLDGGAAVWLWLESGDKRETWRALRRAVTFGRDGVTADDPAAL